MIQKPWTDKEVTDLIRLHETSTASAVAKELGRSKDSVRHKLKWLKAKGGVSSTPKPFKKEKKIEVKPRTISHVSYPPLEWCGNCHSPVSNWSDHVSRMSQFGCKRPS